MPKADNSKKIDSLPLNRLYGGLVLAIFVIEPAVMLVFHFFLETLHLSPLAEGLADSLVLVLVLIPVLHFLFYRPLSAQIASYKQVLKSIQELKTIHDVIIRTAMDSYWFSDTQGRILEVNDSYCRLTGYSRQELLKMSIKDVEVLETNEDTARHIKRIIEVGSDRFESKHRCKDGRIVDLEVSVNYLAGDSGRLFAFLRDITTRKRMEEELLKANKELWELDRLKSEFINMSSHELRTPIAIIREGISQIVEGLHGEFKPEQKYFLDKSFKSVNRLIRVVDNIFDVSELDSGKALLEEESLDAVELSRAVIAGFDYEIKSSGLEIKENFPGNKIELYVDKKKINRVMTELIKNALRFTEKGYIEIKIEDKDDRVEFSVKDTGIGIAEENLPKVFDKFQQFIRDYGPGERGTGLGLALAKGLIELHKGKIWAESRLGEGSKFTFSLPKHIQAQEINDK